MNLTTSNESAKGHTCGLYLCWLGVGGEGYQEACIRCLNGVLCSRDHKEMLLNRHDETVEGVKLERRIEVERNLEGSDRDHMESASNVREIMNALQRLGWPLLGFPCCRCESGVSTLSERS